MFTALNKYGHMIGPAHPQGQYALWSGINCKSLISIQCSLFWFSRKLMLTSISLNVINCTQDLDQGPLVNLVIVISNWIPVHWVDWHCFHSCKCFGFAVVINSICGANTQLLPITFTNNWHNAVFSWGNWV